MDKVSVTDRLANIHEHWRPQVVAELNGQVVRLAKVLGEFIWHHHEHEDELFYVVDGTLRLEFKDRSVTLGAGEMLVVPRGVEHRPVAEKEVSLLLFEPAETRNTGNVYHERLTTPA
jgi:mannose-6-phosphate isomerase-like protein (cupin superfamily)